MLIKHKLLFLGVFALGAASFMSCSDDDTNGVRPFDAGKPITITDFYPDSGGVATPMIIYGSNFGTDTTGVKLWYIDEDGVRHQGGLVSFGYDKDKQQDVMYAYVPKGLTYKRDITLELEHNGVTGQAAKNFKYITQTAVTTVIGKQSNDRRKTVLSTLASTDLSAPMYLAIDDEDNIFIAQRKRDKNDIPGHSNIYSRNENDRDATMLLQANLEKDNIITVAEETDLSKAFNAPAFSAEEGLEGVYVPNDAQVDYVACMKDQDYAGRKTRVLPEQTDWSKTITAHKNYKYCFVVNQNDHMIYTVMYKGELVRINPRTRRATKLLEHVGVHNGWSGDGGGNDAFVAFSPIETNRLFVCLRDAGEIWYVDVDKLASKDSATYTGEPYAGRAINEGVTPGKGYEDGRLLNAKFNLPSQICFTADGKMYIADAGNQCIRQIDTTLGDRATVTTVIGIPGERGFQDGGPEIAKFDFPTGVAVNSDGTIVYVADLCNQVIRRLSIE